MGRITLLVRELHEAIDDIVREEVEVFYGDLDYGNVAKRLGRLFRQTLYLIRKKDKMPKKPAKKAVKKAKKVVKKAKKKY